MNREKADLSACPPLLRNENGFTFTVGSFYPHFCLRTVCGIRYVVRTSNGPRPDHRERETDSGCSGEKSEEGDGKIRSTFFGSRHQVEDDDNLDSSVFCVIPPVYYII
jgi:hypothetical protein